MTKEQLKRYLETTMNDIRTLYLVTQEKIAEVKKQSNSEWTKIYNTPVRMTPEQQASMAELGRDVVNQMNAEYRAEVEKLIQEATEFIATVKKKAVQDLTAAEPLPTDVQLRMAEQIKKEYTTNGNAIAVDRAVKFQDDMNFHVENETVKAYPYYLVAKEVFPDDANNRELLDSVYLKIFPEFAERKAALKEIEECERFFKASVIIHKFDTITNPTEVDQLEMIRMKRELNELGAIDKLNQRPLTYI